MNGIPYLVDRILNNFLDCTNSLFFGFICNSFDRGGVKLINDSLTLFDLERSGSNTIRRRHRKRDLYS
jgi:hypothetical protein